MRTSTLAQVLAKYSAGPQNGIFTDGGASPNPGQGGWGYVWVENGSVVKKDYGAENETTNNRMELTAIINALEVIPAGQQVTIYSDSNLCVQTFNTWAHNWFKNKWKKKGGEIKNLDLIQKAYPLFQEKPQVKLEWIKAHNGWLWNEYADSLATAWARDIL